MRILIAAAALVAFGTMSMPFVDAADSRARAQVLSTKPGNAPADAFARSLQQRKQAKKRQASQAGAHARTKKMFQQRQSPFDQTHGNAKVRKNIIRRMLK